MAQPARGRDIETKERLLEAGARLFAERGFAKVTVRDICRRARANVAAINYHFGGKTGLYEAVLQKAIHTMQGMTVEARAAGDGRTPSQQLHAYVLIFLTRVFENRNGWIHQLMMRELADPTPALDMVIDQVIRPRMAYLAGIVAAILGCGVEDDRVAYCVSSVHSQCLGVVRHPMAPKLGLGAVTKEKIPVLAKHIAAFSVAGIRAVR
jgi:TetR/AcrR family transcriptional regulator, regulator of cefoperazone and chloramphenicol sensitivity